MGLGLPAVVPTEAAQKVTPGLIHLEHLGSDLHCAFEHVQLRTNGKAIKQAGIRAQLAGQQGIALASGIARAHQHPACLRPAQGGHEFAAQCTQGRHVQQQHALVGQPNAAIGGRKMHQPRKS